MTAAEAYGPRDRQCTYKRGYLRRSEAKAAARRTERHPGQGAARMKIYLCPHCGLWHVGHARREDRNG